MNKGDKLKTWKKIKKDIKKGFLIRHEWQGVSGRSYTHIEKVIDTSSIGEKKHYNAFLINNDVFTAE